MVLGIGCSRYAHASLARHLCRRVLCDAQRGGRHERFCGPIVRSTCDAHSGTATRVGRAQCDTCATDLRIFSLVGGNACAVPRPLDDPLESHCRALSRPLPISQTRHPYPTSDAGYRLRLGNDHGLDCLARRYRSPGLVPIRRDGLLGDRIRHDLRASRSRG